MTRRPRPYIAVICAAALRKGNTFVFWTAGVQADIRNWTVP